MPTADFVRALPKAELHLHLEGALEPEMMMALARRNGVSLPFRTVEEIRKAYAFGNLQDFLDIYYKGMSVLLKADDFHDLTLAYLERARADGCVHVEVFFDPQGHTARGVPFAAAADGILAGLEAGRRDLGITSNLIMCFLRHLSEDDAFDTLTEAQPWFGEHIIGVGLDSSEMGHPPSKFARVFAKARDMGLKVTAHAGEEGPPEYVREALDLLKVDRIDHGNRVLEDPALVRRLAAEEMVLTVCPLSNLKLCGVDDLKNHPLKKMLALGLKATVNSDDPAYFGGYVLDNYMQTAAAVGLTRAEITQLARNSIDGSWMEPEDKARHRATLDRMTAHG